MAEAIQDFYPPEFSHCYGCGRLNEHGLQIESRWDGEQAVARFTPEPHHIAVPGFVYGGLIASLIDCHAMATAAAASYAAEGRSPGSQPDFRFVTAALNIDFLVPTPVGEILELKARPAELGRRKVIVAVELWAADQIRVRGQAVAVPMPETMAEPPV
ncbi:MAG: PaaI family thioesterase [Gammaproteobacteria bacterium]